MKHILQLTLSLLISSMPAYTFCAAAANSDLVKAIEDKNLKKAEEAFERGAKLELANPKCWGFMHRAASLNQVKILELLLKNNANIEARTIGESAPIHWATYSKDSLEAVKFLLSKGANIEARTEEGNTVLYSAIDSESPELIKFLLKKGAMVNAENNEGETSLHRAIEELSMNPNSNGQSCINQTTMNSKRYPIISLLVGAGTNLEIRNKRGKSAKDLAQDLNDSEAIKLIEQEEQIREDFYAGRGKDYAKYEAYVQWISHTFRLNELGICDNIATLSASGRMGKLIELKQKRDASGPAASARE